MKNKKLLSLLLAGTMTLSLAACSSGKSAETTAPTQAAETKAAEETKPVAETKAPETAEVSYIGEYTDPDSGSVSMEIAEGKDGDYDVQISIYRLTTLSDGIGTLSPDGLRFTATDANGNPISGVIAMKGDDATVTFTDSTWPLLPNGEQFTYIKIGDEPHVWESDITKEMAYEGVNNYCHSEYDWSVAKEDPSIMYVEMGEESEMEYQVIFRSYTGAFVYFYVDKSTGTTRMTEYVPALDVENDMGTIELFDYLEKKD